MQHIYYIQINHKSNSFYDYIPKLFHIQNNRNREVIQIINILFIGPTTFWQINPMISHSFYCIITFEVGFARHGLLKLLVVHYLIFLSLEAVSTSLHYQIQLQCLFVSLFEDKVLRLEWKWRKGSQCSTKMIK